ncbi:MAG: KH domain-containing protein, partial [Candidatus Heimdallarchaeota archaeon]|nr:KH domain-containing protein [Candidatus Heimdallarchaeota archaeon]
RPEYEIYTFGEQIVVSPIHKSIKRSTSGKPIVSVTPARLQKVLKKYSIYDFNYKFEPPNSLSLFVSDKDRPRVIGKNGKRIEEIEQKLGLSIDVKTFGEKQENEEAEYILDVYPTKSKMIVVFPSTCVGEDVLIAINGEVVFQLTVGKSGEISIGKDTETGRALSEAHKKGATISAIL